MTSELEEPKIVLPDVSLAAIVRDEMMNPAGGIIDFVECTVPHVEEAVIVDTGSVDGTREVLEKLQARYPHLKVFDHPFQDYADARNHSLQQVRTKYALVLDADERLFGKDWLVLLNALQMHSNCDGLYISINNISPDSYDSFGGHNPRIFVNGKNQARYVNTKGRWIEYLHILSPSGFLLEVNSESWTLAYPNASIKHFVPDEKGKDVKRCWRRGISKERIVSPPSTIEGFERWKAYNSRREDYK